MMKEHRLDKRDEPLVGRLMAAVILTGKTYQLPLYLWPRLLEYPELFIVDPHSHTISEILSLHDQGSTR